MSRRSLTKIAAAASVATLAAGLAACSSSSSSTATGSNAAAVNNGSGVPTVTLMVGGIDKQIYLPYQLAQNLGFYKKYGVNVQLSTEQSGGVGAETAMVSGQVDMAGAWYVHAIDFQAKGKNVVDVVQLSGAPGEREMCGKTSSVTSPADWKGKNVGVEQGTIQETYAKTYWEAKGAKVTPYQNQDQVYADMLSGRLDAALQDAVQADIGFLKTPRGAGFEFVGKDLARRECAVAVAQNAIKRPALQRAAEMFGEAGGFTPAETLK